MLSVSAGLGDPQLLKLLDLLGNYIACEKNVKKRIKQPSQQIPDYVCAKSLIYES